MGEDLPIASDAARLAVATRMLGFEARTRTIRLATRLSDDQIRRLYHQAGLSAASSRHRGRSPTSTQQYTRTVAVQLQSSIFSGILVKHGLLKGRRPKPWLHNGLSYAQRFCDAYAEYRRITHREMLSFEQGWHLARTLAARGDLYLQHCARCHSHFVRAAATVLKHQCPLCQLRDQPARGARQPTALTKPRRSRAKRQVTLPSPS